MLGFLSPLRECGSDYYRFLQNFPRHLQYIGQAEFVGESTPRRTASGSRCGMPAGCWTSATRRCASGPTRAILRVYRTPGGHRRFLRQDVESLTQAARPSAEPPARDDSGEGPALRRIRRRLSQDSVTHQPWFQAVEPEGHDRMRLFGRRLLSLLLQESGPPAAQTGIAGRGPCAGPGIRL